MRPVIESDPDIVSAYLEDAAHFPGGHARGVARPANAEEVGELIRSTSGPVLAVGARSSLTGGATPLGELVISTERLTSLAIRGDRVRAGAGVTLADLQQALAAQGRWFPPVPTYLGAFVGGAVATCAAGAATFKYGAVRAWVEGVTVVLADGATVSISRGVVIASGGNVLDVPTSRGTRAVPIWALPLPEVPKRSAGYHMAPGMDLVDLFVGSEGTLGVIVDAELRTAPLPAAACRALVPMAGEAEAIALAGELRATARETWTRRDPRGIDVAAIEHVDARSIAILREDGVDTRLGLPLPPEAGALLLVEIELPESVADDELWQQLAGALDETAPDTPLVRFCRLLDRHGVLDNAEVALPGQRGRAAAFAELREAVPAGVNRRVALARQQVDPSLHKTAADMVVPFERFADMMASCRRLFAERDLDLAVWGHISDGNVHPNLLPHRAGEVARAEEAILALGDEVIAMGGCPLAEHGVGRSRLKQQLLRRLYGDAGINAMRRVKLSLDPGGRLAPGVIFPAQ